MLGDMEEREWVNWLDWKMEDAAKRWRFWPDGDIGTLSQPASCTLQAGVDLPHLDGSLQANHLQQLVTEVWMERGAEGFRVRLPNQNHFKKTGRGERMLQMTDIWSTHFLRWKMNGIEALEDIIIL